MAEGNRNDFHIPQLDQAALSERADSDLVAEYAVGVPQIRQYIPIPELEIDGQNPDATSIQLEVTGLPTRISRNEHGHTTVQVAAARDVDTMTSLLQNCTPLETVVLLNQKTEQEGWTSLHVSTIKNNADVVEYILGMISDDNARSEFINQVDNLSWTSLHWAAARDHVEALERTIGNMSVTDQLNAMTGRWTLLHFTALGNSVNTMKSLMDKFDEEDIKWNILTCSAEDGKAPLHIAVADGNVRAAILLLDIAGGYQEKLMEAKESSKTTVRNFSHSFSFLGEYLKLPVEFNSPSLHQAAKYNDRFLVSWILDKESQIEKLHRKNEDSLTVLQAASKAGSAEVISEISRYFDQDDFINYLTQLSDDGESSVHITALENKAAALLALLRSVKGIDSRRLVLATRNRFGDNVQQTADRMNHQPVITILQCYEMILAGALEKFFKETVKHSLFALNLPKAQIKRRYERIERREDDDKGVKRNINYDAAVCLMYENAEESFAEELVGIAKVMDADSIHTWCNNGILLIRKNSSQEEIEQVAFKVMELIVEPSGTPELRAKIDFAYWLSEGHRTHSKREKSYQMFEECEKEACLHSDPLMKEYCSFFYLKFLIRFIRYDEESSRSDQWFEEKLNKAIDQLLILQDSSEPEYKCYVWLWLAEMQLTRMPEKILQSGVDLFQREVKMESCDPENCLNKAIEFEGTMAIDRKIKARIAKNCLHFAYRCTGIKELARVRTHWYKQALELSEEWMKKHYWLFMCASTSAQALVKLWSIEFYSDNMEIVKQKYRNFRGSSKEVKMDDYWNYLAEHIYNSDFSTHRLTISYLGRAKEHLLKLMGHEDGRQSHGIKFARVKCLLGDPHEEIIEAFEEAEKFSNPGFRKANVFQHRGYYHGISGDFFSAETYFSLALTECDKDKTYKLCLAKNGLKILKRRHNLQF